MIDRWMFDQLTAEVLYRAEQLRRRPAISYRGRRRHRKRRTEMPPVAAAYSRTQEKVSAR